MWKIYYTIKDLLVVKPFKSVVHSNEVIFIQISSKFPKLISNNFQEKIHRKRSLHSDEGFSDEEITWDEMLTKYADIEDEDLEDDPNYKPEADLNYSSTSISSSDSVVDENEIKELQEEAKKDVSELIPGFEVGTAVDGNKSWTFLFNDILNFFIPT